MAYAVAITFTTNPRAVVIKKDWIFELREALSLNNGVNRNQTISIYYSNNLNNDANFGLEVRGFFNPNEEGCYDAKLYRFFDTVEGAFECKRRHRHAGNGFPPVYNDRRLVEQPLPQILNRNLQNQHQNMADDNDRNVFNDHANPPNEADADAEMEPPVPGNEQQDELEVAVAINPLVLEIHHEQNIFGNPLNEDNEIDVFMAPPPQIIENEGEQNFADIEAQAEGEDDAALDQEQQQNVDEELIRVDEPIEYILIESDDEEDAIVPVIEEPEAQIAVKLERVKIEPQDMAAIRILLRARKTVNEAAGEGANGEGANGEGSNEVGIAGPSSHSQGPPSIPNDDGDVIVLTGVPTAIIAKCELDDISGYVPFTTNEFGDRAYFYLGKQFSLPAIFLGLLQHMDDKNEDDDGLFIKLFLVGIVTSENVKNGSIDTDAKLMIRAIFRHRCQKNAARFALFQEVFDQAVEIIKNEC